MEYEILTRHIRKLKQLLIEYSKKSQSFTPLEYLKNALVENENFAPEEVMSMFLKYKKHEQIFQCLVEEYSNKYTTRQFRLKFSDKLYVSILFYVLIFELNKSVYHRVQRLLTKFRKSVINKMLEFMNCEEFLILTTETTCSYFGSDYTLQEIIRPLVQKMNLISDLQEYCKNYFAEKEKKYITPLTVPMSPHITKSHKRDDTPVEPVLEPVTFTAKKPPATTYEEDNSTQDKLEVEFSKNREAAMALLEQARSTTQHFAAPIERTEPTIEEDSRIIKAKKVPKFKEVKVKGNAAMLMRAAHRMTKNCEEEVKKMENMISNSVNPSAFENWEEEERKRVEEESLQNIQKKHLQGLLTREEAIIAKQNIMKQNKEKMIEIKAEKVQLNAELEEWKEAERQKAIQLVEKTQEILKNAKEAEKKVIEGKQQIARLMDEERRALEAKAMEEQEAELNRKMELIKDVKALLSLKNLHKKEFDPTETANLGLMCEMSIAELQERLVCLKFEIEEEQEKKRIAVNETKKQREELLQNAQEIIEQTRSLRERPKKIEKKSIQVKETPEIIALRNRIEEAKKQKRDNAIVLKSQK